MAATYDTSWSTTKDRVRFRVGDVNGSPQWFLQDEEINAALAQYVFPDGTPRFDEVCAICAENIGAQCIQLADSTTVARLKLEFKNRAESAFTLADRIRNLAEPGPGDPANPGAVAARLDGPDLRDYERLLLDRPDRRYGNPLESW